MRARRGTTSTGNTSPGSSRRTQAFEDVERFAHVADNDEIEANDFNLNISRYVDTTEPVEVMSVEHALAQLRDAERRRDEAVAKMDELLAELGYAKKLGIPSGS